jgi:hypothetical protein
MIILIYCFPIKIAYNALTDRFKFKNIFLRIDYAESLRINCTESFNQYTISSKLPFVPYSFYI